MIILLLLFCLPVFPRLPNDISLSSTNRDGNPITASRICTPTITITTGLSGTPCPGIPVTYTAAITNGGTAPVWQWMKNGVPVGTNSPNFFDHAAAGDEVYCILTSNDACATATVVNSNIIRIPKPTIIQTIAGNGATAYAGDGGAATEASLNFPIDLTFDAAGNLYIADAANHRIRKIDRNNGVITTVAGSGTAGFSGDGSLATTAQLSNPTSVSFDAAGNLFIADRNNHRIRKVETSTGIITTVAGTGTAGFSGDGGPATSAALKFPLHVLCNAAGDVYLTDRENNRVRKIAAGTGTISTVAGTGRNTFSGDGGPATAAELWHPTKLAFDPSGNLVIADWGNHRVRKIDAMGIITTIAGTGTEGSTGDGGLSTSARLSYPTGLCFDNWGNLYIADVNHVIRKVVVATGLIEKIAGTAGGAGFTGDGGEAANARLNGPSGMRFDADGNLVLCDYLNHRIRKISVSKASATQPVISASASSVCTNGGTVTLSVSSGSLNGATEWTWYTTTCGGMPIGTGNTISVSPTMTTTYTVRGEGGCVAPGLCGSITITVGNAVTPTLSISPTSVSICFNFSPQFTATATNAGNNVTYQWKKNGIAVPGATNISQILPVAANDVISCELTTTNNCGNTVTVASNNVAIQPNPGYEVEPEVTIAASQETICTGTLVTFTATNVSESATPVYQWLINGNFIGVLGPVFSTRNLAQGDKVECIMTVPHCQGGGSTKDYSNAIIMTVNTQQNPKVSISPIAVSICKGIPVTFTAKAENAGPSPSYHWKINDLPVGTNSNTFTSTTLNHNDRVTCEVRIDPAVSACTNGTGAVSNAVTLSVDDAFTPSLVVTASQQEICQGTPVTFTATGTDTGPLPTYQWQVNGVVVGTNNTAFTADQLRNGDVVSCTLVPANACGSVAASDAVTITVHANPEVSFATPSVTIEPGKQIQLTPIVQGAIASHQWTPANLLVNPTSLTPTTVPLSAVSTFTLLVQTAAGCKDTASFTVTAYNKLYMPNSFTPNGDGRNDLFRIPSGAPIVLKEFSVYDRWGGLVFTTTDRSKGWDGKQKGTNATAGTYVYLVRAEDANGEMLLKGTVQLIR